MQKIFNWTVGSFFRSIGRIIAYLVVGGLIAYLLSSNDFRIEDLFLEKVNASTLYWVGSSQYRVGDIGSWTSISSSSDNYYQINKSLSSNQKYFFAFDNQKSVPENGTARFNIKFIIDTVVSSDITINNPSTTCTINSSYESPAPWGNIYDANWNITGRYEDVELRYSNFICNSSQATGSVDTIPLSYGITLAYYYNNSTDLRAPCYAVSKGSDTYTFDCPLVSNNINGLVILVDTNQYIDFRTGFYWNFNSFTDSTTDIINNQNQNTQSVINNQNQNHQDIMDSNTSEADSEGQDFINNFSNNTHGLTGIITAPLNAIQSLASATCSSLVLPLPFTNNKTLTLPCMSTIYSNHFGAFYTMYQGIILALISYWVCVRLFTLAKGFKDPDDDKIEVVDL